MRSKEILKMYIQGKDTVDFETFNYLKLDECLGYFDMDFEIDDSHYKVYKFDAFPKLCHEI